VLEESGVDLFDAQPKLLDPGVVEHSDVAVTMGYGAHAPFSQALHAKIGTLRTHSVNRSALFVGCQTTLTDTFVP
jgi:hypothetical protein